MSIMMDLRPAALVAGGDLVERRVGHLVDVDFRRALNDLLQRLQDLGVGVAAVCLRVLPALPQADGHGFRALTLDGRDLVLESALLAHHGEDVGFHGTGEFGGGVRLQVQRDVASKHDNSSGFATPAFDWHCPSAGAYPDEPILSSEGRSVDYWLTNSSYVDREPGRAEW